MPISNPRSKRAISRSQLVVSYRASLWWRVQHRRQMVSRCFSRDRIECGRRFEHRAGWIGSVTIDKSVTPEYLALNDTDRAHVFYTTFSAECSFRFPGHLRLCRPAMGVFARCDIGAKTSNRD